MSSKGFWLRSSLGILAILVLLAWGIVHWYLSNFTKDVGDRLVLLNELRKGAVEQYLSTARAELQFWSTNPDILATQQGFHTLLANGDSKLILSEIKKSYAGQNPGPTGEFNQLDDGGNQSSYSELHRQLHPLAKLFVSERGYYDIFLIGPEGEVYYTVEKESDFATNIKTGPLKDSGLASVFHRAMQAQEEGVVVISDMQAYAPSDNAPAMFMARVLKNPDGAVIGVIAFQLPTTRILDIMSYTAGMGETGETYLVGQDKLMRSNSRFSVSDTVLVQKVDTSTVNKALAGKKGVEFITDYRGIEVLSAYTSLEVGDNSWAVIAEFDRQEIVSVAASERPSLGGALSFIFVLALWSLWYWRGGRAGSAVSDEAMTGLELGESAFADSSSIGS